MSGSGMVIGIGDVGGPSPSTTTAIAVFDDETGRVLRNTSVLIDVSDNVTGVVNLTQTGYTDVTAISTPINPAATVARLYSIDSGGGTVTLAYRDSNGVVTPLAGGNVTGSGATDSLAKWSSSSNIINTGVSLSAGSNMSGVNNFTQTGYTDITAISTPTDPAATVARLYALDSGGGTVGLAFRDSNGVETVLGAGVTGTGTDERLVRWSTANAIQNSGYSLTDADLLSQPVGGQFGVDDGTAALPFLKSSVDGSTITGLFYTVSGTELNVVSGGTHGAVFKANGDLHIGDQAATSGDALVALSDAGVVVGGIGYDEDLLAVGIFHGTTLIPGNTEIKITAGEVQIRDVLSCDGNDHMLLPLGTTGDRTANVEGRIRGNSSTGNAEYNDGAAYIPLGPGRKITAVSTTYSVIAGDQIIEADASGGAFSITLLAVGSQNGELIIKKVDETSNAVTLVGTIDGDVDPFFDGSEDSITIYPSSSEYKRIF